jgi:hypothetical protein
MPTGGGGTRPADAGPATCSCSGGHPPAPAVSAADTSRPDTDLVDTDRSSGNSSGRPRRPRCPVPPPPRHRPRCPAAAERPPTAAAVAAPRQDRRMSDLLACAGQLARSTQPAENRCPDAWTPDAACRTPRAARPGTADTRDRRRAWGHCGSGHAGQPAAGPSTTGQQAGLGLTHTCACGLVPSPARRRSELGIGAAIRRLDGAARFENSRLTLERRGRFPAKSSRIA